MKSEAVDTVGGPVTPEPRVLARVVEQTADAVMITDASGAIEYVNPAFETLTGYSAAEVLGRKPSVLKSGKHGDSVYRGLWETILRGEPYRSLILNRRKDGTIYYSQKTITPIKDDSGRIVQFVSTDKDVTEQKETEQRHHEDLQQLAYAASHDLQEPLRTISLDLQVLQRMVGNKLDAAAVQCIDGVIEAASRMRALVRDFLSYSRVENDERSFARCDLQTVLKEVTADLAAMIQEASARVIVGKLPRVMADTPQMRTVFQNLIANGIKFRGTHPPEIVVTAERRVSDWLFTVRDNGIGIDPRHSERIFQMFERLHSRERYPGTGIGLAVTRKIIERHGGRIWVNSELGKGSSFHFTLPLGGGDSP